jgi:predicted secreted Zn-dependent protease
MYIKPHKPIATLLTTISLLLSQSTPSISTITETLKFQTYDVKINPKQSLYNALNQASPIRQDGQILHGLTTWNVHWNSQLRFDRTGDPCRVTIATTQLTGTILLPKLIGGTAPQRQQFTRFLALLRKHELNHYAFGKQAVVAIYRSILAQPIAPDCSTLDRQIKASAIQILTTYESRSLAYDVKTNHGQTEGVFLPN